MKQTVLFLFVAILIFAEFDGNNIIKYASNHVRYDEYYVVKKVLDKDINLTTSTIHSRNCRKYRWSKANFKPKYSKYFIKIGSDIDRICDACFEREEAELLITCHHYNLKFYTGYLKRRGLTGEEIGKYLSEYNLNPSIEELYGEYEEP